MLVQVSEGDDAAADVVEQPLGRVAVGGVEFNSHKKDFKKVNNLNHPVKIAASLSYNDECSQQCI
jgi:hypothetical protein